MIRKIEMKNLTCSNCIAKVERRTSRLPYVNSASFNYAKQILLVDFKEDYDENIALKEIKGIVDILEDNIITHYYEQKIEVKKTNFFKEYKFVLFGVALILYTFSAYTIVPSINNVFRTTFEVPTDILKDILYWVGYVFLISKLLWIQIRGIKNFNIFNENTLMIIATFAAMWIGKYEESVAVVILYSLGEYLQNRAVQKSKNEISSLIDLKVDYANVLIDGKIVIKDPDQVKVGDVIVVKNGERIPMDGKVILGSTSLNTSELTGESKLKTVNIDDDVLSGNINVGDVIHIKVSQEYENSTLAKIIDLIENATNKKSKREMFITKFAKIYTPIVVGLAALLVVYGLIWHIDNIDDYIYRAAIFLVISCPCSLVLSVPLSYYAGIGTAAKNGILFKGSTYLHSITEVELIALDKTGTLTHGDFFVKEFSNMQTLMLAASIEKFSNHPIAKAILDHNNYPIYKASNVKEIPGYGISGEIDGKIVLAGSRKFLESNNIKVSDEKLPIGSYTFVSLDNEYVGYIIVKDELKETSMETVRDFTKEYDTVMLTGDNEISARDIALQLGGIEYYSELLPEEKLSKFNDIRTNSVSLFVGDGINDAPLLKNADIGVSLGSATDLAIEVSDVIIINNDIRLLDKAIKIAKKTRSISAENIIFSLVVKIIFLIMSTIGLMWMWLSIFADVGVAIICVLNALRIIYQKKYLKDKD
ncbi:MAG: heavy metal translocating P-type ATPase [Candidatus Izemoplasmatales bacterium]|nr:heavy metal translocating P-type ATPase [Candidatus Izemoplasmatales bacterium]MDD4068926.1 heavy metal translocating P-type ATPase [Candidatus Izemoplasmatales bacterium]